MIDPKKCVFEDAWDNRNSVTDPFITYYFIYQVDWEELDAWNGVSEFGEDGATREAVVAMCVSLQIHELWGISMALSPTVESDEGDRSDVDWAELVPDVNFTKETVLQLVALAGDSISENEVTKLLSIPQK